MINKFISFLPTYEIYIVIKKQLNPNIKVAENDKFVNASLN